MKYIKGFLILALIALLVIQFIRPEKNSGDYASIIPFETETQASNTIKGILKTNCYDCHSNSTTYPWYAEIAPVSYWLEEHIVHGKGHFNASDWENYSLKKKDHKLEELVEFVEDDKMPLPSYTWAHGKLPKEDKDALLQWAKHARVLLKN